MGITNKTDKLGLFTFDTSSDAETTTVYDFVDYTSASALAGDISNVMKIDNFAIETSASLVSASAVVTTLANTTSACFVGIDSSLATIEQTPHSAVIQIVDNQTIVTVNRTFELYAPTELNGLNLSRAVAFHNTSGSELDTIIQVKNITRYSSYDCLSTPIVIYAGDTSGSIPSVIDTSYDDVQTDDCLQIYMTAVSGSWALGLQVILEFTKPSEGI
jgi:hypothetical protein